MSTLSSDSVVKLWFVCSFYCQAQTLEPKVKPDKLHRDRLTACLNKVSKLPIFNLERFTATFFVKSGIAKVVEMVVED